MIALALVAALVPGAAPSQASTATAAPTAPSRLAAGQQVLYLATRFDLYRVEDYDTVPSLVHVGPLAPDLTDIAHVPGAPELIGMGKGGDLWAIDPGSGATRHLGHLPEAFGAESLEAAPDGTLYARVGAFFGSLEGNLLRIDPSVPSATVVGATGMPCTGGLAIDVDGTLYGMGTKIAPMLQRLDPATGTILFRTNFLPVSGSLEIDRDGMLYAVTGQALSRMSKQTGLKRKLAQLPLPPGHVAVGLAFLLPAGG